MKDTHKHATQTTPSHASHGDMGTRGVTRPMADDTQHAHHPDTAASSSQQAPSHHHMNMSQEQRHTLLTQHHQQTLWVYWTLIMLGIWLVMAPLTFDYGKNAVAPAGGREVWISLADRVTVLQWSDVLCGVLLIFLGWRSLTPNRPYSLWLGCLVGVWLSAAPIIFWAPNSVVYLNDTFVGLWVLALTILIPGMPNMIMYMQMGAEVPPGWSYNPSSWAQRWIMIVTGFIGWMVSRYLAAFQLGYIDQVWDPFFGNGSINVLNSTLSHSLPVSDAGLGALAYTFEFLMGFMGSPSRWRTMPWMVTFFGILVIPLGLVHIFLVISQPVIVGSWCLWCLVAAGVMLPMIPLEIDEVVAMAQHMRQATRRGEKFWRVFWKGGKPAAMNHDARTPLLDILPQNPWQVVKASVWGMRIPWSLCVSAIIGLWIICAPGVFHISIETTAAHINHLGGALMVVVSVISMGEVVRSGRYLNIPLGILVAIAPWFIQGSFPALNVSNVISGFMIATLALARGNIKETYGSWDRYIR